MFVEFMNGGSLANFIQHFSKKVSDEVISYVIKRVLIGVYDIHSNRQVHRDLKSENILLNGDVKIADFGIAIQQTK